MSSNKATKTTKAARAGIKLTSGRKLKLQARMTQAFEAIKNHPETLADVEDVLQDAGALGRAHSHFKRIPFIWKPVGNIFVSLRIGE